jgi:hypothetical protein
MDTQPAARTHRTETLVIGRAASRMSGVPGRSKRVVFEQAARYDLVSALFERYYGR